MCASSPWAIYSSELLRDITLTRHHSVHHMQSWQSWEDLDPALTKIYYGGMSLAVDMIIEMKDVKTPSLLQKMNVAIDIHNDICKLVQSGNYPPSRQATSLENIRQIISKASNDAAAHSLHNNYEDAIRIYRELGLCCVKCRHLPMLGVMLSHIAKCAVLAKISGRPCYLRRAQSAFKSNVVSWVYARVLF
jgi:hypothetical protein